MSDYEKTLDLLTEMRSRFDSGFSSDDKKLLNSLHRLFYGKNVTNTGCNNCYRDAFLLIYSKLKKTGNMPKISEYRLKAGAVIHPMGTSKFYANQLPSNDIAEAYLSLHPEKISLFSEYPNDWRNRVEQYKLRAENQQSDAEEPSPGDLLQELENLKKENLALKERLRKYEGEEVGAVADPAAEAEAPAADAAIVETSAEMADKPVDTVEIPTDEVPTDEVKATKKTKSKK